MSKRRTILRLYHYLHMLPLLHNEILVAAQIRVERMREHLVDERERFPILPKDVIAAPEGARAPEGLLEVRLVSEKHAFNLAVQLGALLPNMSVDVRCQMRRVHGDVEGGSSVTFSLFRALNQS